MTRVPSTDVLRLQVADDPSGLANLVANPSGELGGWGWVTPAAGTSMSGDPGGGGLTYLVSTAVGLWWFQTEDMPITATRYAASSWRLITSTPPPASGLWVRNDVQWINAAGTVISTTTPSPWVDTTLAANRGHAQLYGPNQAPAGTVKFRLRFSFARASDGSAPTTNPYSMRFDQVTVATAATAAELGTMVTNLVPDPSLEENPWSTWTPAGPNVTVTRDTAQHYHAAASAKLVSKATTVRTNLMRNPSFIADASGWMTSGDTHTTFSRDTSANSLDGHSVVMHGDGSQNWVLIRGDSSNVIPVAPGDRIGGRASFRYGSVGGSWTGNTSVYLVVYWCDLAGNLLPNAESWTLASKVGMADGTYQGRWWVDDYLWGQLDIPTKVDSGGGAVTPTAIRVGIKVVASKNISAAMSVFADRFLVEKTADQAGPYFDGSTPDTSLVTYDYVAASGGTDSARTSTATTKVATTQSPGVQSAQFAIRPGRPYTVSAAVKVTAVDPPTSGVNWYARLSWFDADHQPLALSQTQGLLGQVTAAQGWVRAPFVVTTPAAAMFASVGVYPGAVGPLDSFNVDAVQVEPGSVMGAFVIGQVTTGGLPYIPPVSWVNIIGATHDITVARQSLNVGTMTATVLDASLDPSQSALIRPGRAVRLMALPMGLELGEAPDRGWQPVFTGAISQAEVTYDPQTPVPKRAKVMLSAVDALARLANIARDEGVGTIADLPYVLEGCGVPWDVNGSGNQVPTATVVARNDSSSALDQLAITRDSALGVAWLDRFGTLHAYDAAQVPPGVTATLDEDRYSDIDISFNTAAVINEVNLAYQRFNPTTGDTDEIPYGPYVDAPSVAQWGAFAADFRVQGIHEDATTLAAYAQKILTANATPVRRINSVTVPVRELRDIATDRALLDLENLTGVQNQAAELTTNLRIESIDHHITTTTWLVTFGFTVNGQVAAPTFTPAPGNTNGQTLDQMLRPVGEVTMFYGAKSAIPAGWLPLDGSTFSLTTYPALGAMLGSNTLPNMADRFPIGAGTKALGTTGGSSTHVQTVAELAAHAHTNTHTHPMNHGHDSQKTNTAGSSTGSFQAGQSTGVIVNVAPHPVENFAGDTGNASSATGQSGSASPMDVLNPWRSLWFIIRAV